MVNFSSAKRFQLGVYMTHISEEMSDAFSHYVTLLEF